MPPENQVSIVLERTFFGTNFVVALFKLLQYILSGNFFFLIFKKPFHFYDCHNTPIRTQPVWGLKDTVLPHFFAKVLFYDEFILFKFINTCI